MPEPLKHINDYFASHRFLNGKIRFPEPLKKRLAERKRMTIAIGLMCSDGIVLAADTHESTGLPGDLKTTARKIQNAWGTWSGALLVSGAGPSGYLTSISSLLVNAFNDEPGRGTAFTPPSIITNTAVIEAKFEAILYSFYTKHVLQPQERQAQHFDLIIALARPNGTRMLWSTSQTAMTQADMMDAVAVGVGAPFAYQLMTFHWPFKTIQEMVLFAAYVIYRVKKSVDGCGEYTDIAYIETKGQKADLKLLRPFEVKVMENQFDRYRILEGHIVDYALGREAKDEQKAREVLMRSLDSIRAAIQAKPERPNDFDELWRLWK